jgi:hypothetical protein
MKKTNLILLVLLFGFGQIMAQTEEPKEKSASAAQANNPLANMTALNFHNYYIPKLTDAPDDMYLNNAWVRFAKPFAKGRLLLRVSVPLNTIGIPDNTTGIVTSTNGLGDINAFVSYNFVSKPTATVGIGPLISAPTATENSLGAEKWQGGLAFVAFIAKSPVFQFGGLITWQTSFAGNEDRANTNMMGVQPFYFFQLGKGTYLRGAPIWAFDIENNSYHVPFALGIGKVVKVGNTVFNLFVEPQYSLLHQGTQPQLQIFTGINLQFINNK